MLQGYLVSLGDTSLDNGDVISGAYVTFTTDTNLGSGSWTWSGVAGSTNYTNEVEPGIYYLATNGNIYFESQFGAVYTINSAQATNLPAYSSNDGTMSGTAGDDIIEDGYTGDPDTDTVMAVADIMMRVQATTPCAAAAVMTPSMAALATISLLGPDSGQRRPGQHFWR